MGLYTSPAAGGVLPPDPTFAGLVTADAFAATDGGPPGRSGSFRTGHDIDVLVARDAGDTSDVGLLTYVAGTLSFANPSTLNALLLQMFSGGFIAQRFAGLDTIATYGDHVERAHPEYGIVGASSPYGSDGMVDVNNPDADYDEIADNYRYRRLTYLGATSAPRTINLPPAAGTAGYYEKTIKNQTGNNLTINTVGSIGLGVTIANNKTAVVGFTPFVALRVSGDA